MNLLYVVPNLDKVSGGPSTRITLFKKKILEKGGVVVQGRKKILKSIKAGRIELTYIESATNRISLVDVFSLLIIRARSKNVIVFIRDIYIELFPEEYSSPRKKVTLFANRLSYFFLVLITNEIAFPTNEMGNVFFNKNKYFPKRNYFPLPPGTVISKKQKVRPDFTKKIGVLYLGGISYSKSGFEHFLDFAKTFRETYKFYVLSGDPLAKEAVSNRDYIYFDKIAHNEIEDYIEKFNIGFGFHSRPRNIYDDLTFPIKILDFITFKLPFITEKHKPLISLLGRDYPLFVDISNGKVIKEKINSLVREDEYAKMQKRLNKVAIENTYDIRFKTLLEKRV